MTKKSWVDNMISWMERSRFPAWMLVLLASSLLYLGFSAVQWAGGVYPRGSFNLFHAFFIFELAYLPLLMVYLNRSAESSLREYQPVLKGDEQEQGVLRQTLLNSPPRQTLIMSIVPVLGFILMLYLIFGQGIQLFGGDTFDIFQMADTPLSVFSVMAVSAVRWFLYGGFGYHVYHQLKCISAIYNRWTVINIWDTRPLYALSMHTAKTAIGVIVSPYLWFATGGDLSATTFSIAMSLILGFLGILIFILPLRGVHEILKREKDQQLSALAKRLNTLMRKLDALVEGEEFAKIGGVDNAIRSYQGLKESLDAVPTWPWQPGLFRNLLGALSLPILIWILQQILETYLQFE